MLFFYKILTNFYSFILIFQLIKASISVFSFAGLNSISYKMNKITLNFFGEEVSINIPTNLSSLRKEISEKFAFSPSDAAELIISYANNLGKKLL